MQINIIFHKLLIQAKHLVSTEFSKNLRIDGDTVISLFGNLVLIRNIK